MKKKDLQSTSPIGSTKRIRRLPFKKRIIKFIGRITFWYMQRTAGLLRPWSIKFFGNSLGLLFYIVSRRYRNVALKNLRAVYGQEKSEREIKSIAKQVFQNFTRGAFEFFYFLSLSKDQINELIDIRGIEYLDNAHAQGKGCIVLTAHYGNWELMARAFVNRGYKVNVIARDSDDPGMTGIATQIRENGGYRVFDKDQPVIGAVRALKKNEYLGILPDQNDSHGIFVDFFSRPVATAVGPAVLSLRSGAPIVPVFAPRVGDKYVATVYPPIEFEPSGDEDKDVHDLMTLVNRVIENEVRKDPTQWLWLHDRWKLTPKVSDNGN